ncbi:MAG: flagellar type III secretion system pore protein FliP [Bdellovibrionota bacterium]
MSDDVASLFAELGLSVISVLVLVFLALLFSCYVKIVTVLGMVRAGIGLGSLPAAFVTGGLALALSFFVMFPQLRDSANAMDGVLKSKSVVTDRDRAQAVNAGVAKWKQFLEQHVHPDELHRFSGIATKLNQKAGAEVGEQESLEHSWQILAPAFLVSELKDAFRTGLSVFLPFLVIDLLAATILVAVGLERLNPSVVSFPLKVLLFVLVDGWALITTNLVATYSS